MKRENKGNELYRMAGIPDGLGALDNGEGTITVLMSHELTATAGVSRTHGGTGAFVSRWQISSGIIEVTDLFGGVAGYDVQGSRYFLLDVQAHYALGGELVEGGQLLLMKVPP